MKHLLLIFYILISLNSIAAEPIVLNPSYQHDRWVAKPRDVIKEFRAFTASMDSLENDDNFGEGEAFGTPEWVAYQIKSYSKSCIPTKPRPEWKSEEKFVEGKIAPTDASYKYSRAFRKSYKDWYERGHLQMKLIAERMGHDAAANTHTFLNAVPQRATFNKGIWLDLEYITSAWADKYGSVWVITGPIYVNEKPSGYIGEDDEFKVGIPDALFKIVVKEGEDSKAPDVLAFIYPQVAAGYFSKNYDHTRFLTTIDEVELLTGLDFLTIIEDDIEKSIEASPSEVLWEYDKSAIVRACPNNEEPR
ncbi:DNA/RNA non-specific endonuclease [Alteromonas portus]|uniref:DNA/RNA non-specific endonuclease n=1 Tax=Alteromonas portus TaxID=2565549 RepID=UPI003BF857F5